MKAPLRITDVDILCTLAYRGRDFEAWYAQAQAEIAEICEAESWDIERFTCILALLSPRVAVRRNIRMALQFIGTGKHLDNTLGSIKRSVEHFNKTGEIRGKKTGPFAQALLGDVDAIVLDTWMAKALLPDETDPNSNSFKRIATRAAANDAIRHVAARLKLSPRDAQACIWAGVFREFGGNPPFFPIREEYENWVSRGRSFPASGAIDGDADNVQFSPDATDAPEDF